MSKCKVFLIHDHIEQESCGGYKLTAEFGDPPYERLDAPATAEQKARLAKISPEATTRSTLAGQPIIAELTNAPGNQAPIGGLKVTAGSGCFAARPSGTENIY